MQIRTDPVADPWGSRTPCGPGDGGGPECWVLALHPAPRERR